MSYVVLARKWRPKYFEEVVGQGHVARTLINSIEQDRVAHGYLFCGTRGVGKTTTARILAKALNCEQGPTATPCYECASCTEITDGQSVDVFEIDGASNRGINEIRELREGVRYAPSRDRFKIYIIDEVHMLTNEAFNALLKTLEEPPEHAHFIFATTEPQKIPVTILSRCQRFDFKRIGQNDIVDHLTMLCEVEDIDAERAALQLIARQAAGGMRDAMSLLDQVISFAGDSVTEAQVAQILGVANRKHLFELSEAIIDADAERALGVLDEVHRYGYDLQQFASEFVSHLRDLVVTAVVENPDRVTGLTESELAAAREQIGRDRIDDALLHRYFTVMADGATEMARSPYPKLLFEMTLVRLARLEPLVGLDLIVDQLSTLESHLTDEMGDAAAAEALAEAAPAKKKSSPADQSATAHLMAGGHTPAPSAPKPERQPQTAAAPPPAEAHTYETQPAEASAAPAASPAPAAPPAAPPVGQPEPPEAPAAPEPAPEPDDEPSIDEPPIDEAQADAAADEDEAGPDDAAYDADEGFAPADEAPEPEDAADEQSPDDQSTDAETKDAQADALAPLDLHALADITPAERWAEIVARLHRIDAPLAATCEHAYVEQLGQGRVEVAFTDQYLSFVEEGDRLQRLERAVRALLGPSWSLRVGRKARDEAAAQAGHTLADKRESDRRQRLEDLEEHVRTHPVVQQATELFSPEKTRVQVQLHDDPA